MTLFDFEQRAFKRIKIRIREYKKKETKKEKMSDIFGQPASKQQYQPSVGGSAPSQNVFAQMSTSTELEGPDEPEVQTNYEPDDMARMHFLIHSNKMLMSFAKAFPSCASTQMAKAYISNQFPRLPLRVDNNTHAEMRYPMNEQQKKTVTDWISQFYKVMTHKVTFNGKTVQVAQFFQHRKPQGWGFVVKHIKMIGMLNLQAKWSKMSDSSKNNMWRFMDILYRDAKQFMGFKNLENLIPPKMRAQLEQMMTKNGGPSGDNPMGISQEDAQKFVTNMDPNMMQGFIQNVFSSPEQTQRVMQSVSDVAGGDMGQLTGFMQNIFKTAQ